MNLQIAHQSVRAVHIPITAAAGVSATAASNALCELPSGAVVVGGDLTVKTAFGSSRTASIGDATLATRYATTVDLNATGRTSLTLTGYQHDETEKLLLTLGGSVPTVGEAVLTILYLIAGAGDYVQG